MPYGLPSAIFLSRSEWALEYETNDPVQLTAGTVVYPVYPLADQDGWDGEWLCKTADGRQIAMLGDKLEFHQADGTNRTR
jgi:hypothetical protein